MQGINPRHTAESRRRLIRGVAYAHKDAWRPLHPLFQPLSCWPPKRPALLFCRADVLSPRRTGALAPFWFPVAFAQAVTDKPYAARLLDERVAVFRLSDGTLAAARDICFHRGLPLSMGRVEGDEIICKYHGLRYDRERRSTCIPAPQESTSIRQQSSSTTRSSLARPSTIVRNCAVSGDQASSPMRKRLRPISVSCVSPVQSRPLRT